MFKLEYIIDIYSMLMLKKVAENVCEYGKIWYSSTVISKKFDSLNLLTEEHHQ